MMRVKVDSHTGRRHTIARGPCRVMLAGYMPHLPKPPGPGADMQPVPPPKPPHRPALDLEGQAFGQLRVLRAAPRIPGQGAHAKGRRAWYCRCSCGAETRVRADHLVHGTVTSCGHERRWGRAVWLQRAPAWAVL